MASPERDLTGIKADLCRDSAPESVPVLKSYRNSYAARFIAGCFRFLNAHRETIVSLTARHKLPAIYPWRFFVEMGGLLSYGSEQRDEFRLAATYADRILKGEKASELPVQAPTQYDFVINLKTAKLLGLTVTPQMQQLANKLLE